MKVGIVCLISQFSETQLFLTISRLLGKLTENCGKWPFQTKKKTGKYLEPSSDFFIDVIIEYLLLISVKKNCLNFYTSKRNLAFLL